MALNNYFKEIEEKYLEFTSAKNSPEIRRHTTRFIVENIVNSYFDQKEIWTKFVETNKNNAKYNKYIFRDSIKGKIEFLTENSYLALSSKNALIFVYDEACDFGSHGNKGKGNINFMDSIQIFVNEILIDYYYRNRQELNFLISQENILNELISKQNDLENSIEINKKEEKNLNSTINNLTNSIEISNKEKETLNNTIDNLTNSIKKTRKKEFLIYTLASVLTLLLVASTFLIKSLYSDLDSSQEKVKEYVKTSSSQNELIKSKQAKIDSLNLIINTSQQKSNINNGIQNDFKGKVGNVTNVGKVDKLEI